MTWQTMYPGMVNSPETTITNGISESDTIIYVQDPARVPELPNLMTLGTGTNAETVLVTAINNKALTVQRGFQGIAKSWPTGTVIARNFTEYDYGALKENIEYLEANKETPAGAQAMAEAKAEAAAGAVRAELEAHVAENVTQKEVHGLKIESGIWTPIINGWSEGDHTYSIQEGKYTRIGNMVHISFRIALSVIASDTGELEVKGLPFVPKSTASAALIYRNLDTSSDILGLISNNINTIVLMQQNKTPGGLPVSALKNNTVLIGSIVITI